MQPKSFAAFAVGLTLVALALPALSSAQNTLYDNFNSSKFIDPTKWVGLQNYNQDTREEVRGLVPTPGVKGDNRLRISQRGYSATTDNTGGTGDSLGLLFAAPGTVSAVSFTVVAKTEQTVGCSGNPDASGVSAGFEGSFFNTGNFQNGAQGDVKANIVIVRTSNDTGNSLNVGAGYYQCNDANCATATQLFSQGLGAVNAGSTNTLNLKWNQAQHQFTFQLNSNAPVTSTYSVNDSFPPGFDNKYLYSARFVPHCTTTPRPFTFVDSYFDNVFVNP